MLRRMGDASLTTELGSVLVTGGSGFVGANLVTTLIERGHKVRSFDRAPSPLPQHPKLEVLHGDITDVAVCEAAVDGIDTIIHTAAIIDLMGGASVTEEYRQRSFSVNVGGTQNLVYAGQKAGVKRFVYTASNSVVMGGQNIAGGTRRCPTPPGSTTSTPRPRWSPSNSCWGRTVLKECSPARSGPAAFGAPATRRCSASCSKV